MRHSASLQLLLMYNDVCTSVFLFVNICLNIKITINGIQFKRNTHVYIDKTFEMKFGFVDLGTRLPDNPELF